MKINFEIKKYDGYSHPVFEELDDAHRNNLKEDEVIETLDAVAYRNFNQDDRIKTYFNGKWLSGVVIAKYKVGYKDEENTIKIVQKKYPFYTGVHVKRVPRILIKTDELIDKPEGVLNGHGLQGAVDLGQFVFEKEPTYDSNNYFEAIKKSGYDIYKHSQYIRKKTEANNLPH
jgi:hypothetical protein